MITEKTYYPACYDRLHRTIKLEELSKFVRELEKAGCDPVNTTIYLDAAGGLMARELQ